MKKKIFHLITSLKIGGTERFVLSIIKHLHQNYDFEVAYLKEDGPVGKEIRQWAPVRKVSHLGIARWLREGKPDILHTHLYRANILGRIAGKLCGVPKIISDQRALDYWAWPWHRWLNTWTAGWCDVILANSHRVGDHLVEDCHIPKGKIEMIPNGIERERVVSNKTKREARQSLGLPQHQVIVGSLMRLDHQKCIDLLPGVIRDIRRWRPEVFFAIAGDGPGRARFVKDLGDFPGWKLVGELDSVSDFLASLDVFFLFSRDEGASNALLEARMAGISTVFSFSNRLEGFLSDIVCEIDTLSDRREMSKRTAREFQIFHNMGDMIAGVRRIYEKNLLEVSI